jgi:NAD-dependent deacetylase
MKGILPQNFPHLNIFASQPILKTMASLETAAQIIKNAKHLVAFTRAGISVESGIPPFRGAEGLWSKYNPEVLELNYFYRKPLDSWKVIKEIFYDFFGHAHPNAAHIALAKLEDAGILDCVITQNIDNLHQAAGSRLVHEFHGNSQKLVCTSCSRHYEAHEVELEVLPPVCYACKGLLKPDFIFFGESIPMGAYQASIAAAEKADVFLIIGSTGEVMPANNIPVIAKQSGAKIVEINPEPSHFTPKITDVYIAGKAGETMTALMYHIF